LKDSYYKLLVQSVFWKENNFQTRMSFTHWHTQH